MHTAHVYFQCICMSRVAPLVYAIERTATETEIGVNEREQQENLKMPLHN